MLNSAILEVIIGMIFVYSLLSILVTQINTLIVNMLKLRAKHLRQGIQVLLTDAQLQAKVFTHPLIQLVNEHLPPDEQITMERAKEIADGKLNDVTWLDPETFVEVLLSIVKGEADELLFGALNRVIEAMPTSQQKRILRELLHEVMTTGKGLDKLTEAINAMQDSEFGELLKEALGNLEFEIGQAEVHPEGIGALIAGLQKVRNESFRIAIETIVRASKTVEEAQKKLVKWFNDGMNRASTAYTQRLQLMSLALGLAIAIFVNVDSINLARTLWEDPLLREQVAAAARATDLAETIAATAPAADDTTNGTTAGDDTSESTSGDTETGSAGDANGGDSDVTLEDVQQSAAAAQQTVSQILALRLPIGWYWQDLSDQPDAVLLRQDTSNLWNLFPGNNPDHWLGLLLQKIIGWIATMIAIAQGAPFWFNLLNRLMGRGSS